MSDQNARLLIVECLIPAGILAVSSSLKRTVDFQQMYPGSGTSNYILQSINEAYLLGVQKGTFDGRVETDKQNHQHTEDTQQLTSTVSAYETDPESLFPNCFIPVTLLKGNQTLHDAVSGLSAKTTEELRGDDILGLINSAYSLGVTWNAQNKPRPASMSENAVASLDYYIHDAQSKLLDLVDEFMQNGAAAGPVDTISNLLYDWLTSGTVDLKKRYNADQLYQATELIKFIVRLHKNYVRLQSFEKGGQGNGK